jgi:Skp family chaperone for outer membrane proteins
MIFFKINIFLNILKIFLVSIFCISISLAQEENLDENNNDLSISQTFPIAVVDMQRIVGQSLAAVKVREYIENKKEEFGTELKNEEQELKTIQEDLASQRSIMPPDEFAELEATFRKRVEALQQMVAERNQLLEEMLSKSVQIIQLEAIKIITEIGKEKQLALTLDTSTVVIAANSINISSSVIELLNINLPEVDMDAIMSKE